MRTFVSSERIFAAVAVAALASASQIKRKGYKLDPVPAADFTPESYMGRWYQMYDDVFEQATFENASLCDTADYALLPNGTITVLNRERQVSVDGPERALNGYATCPPGKAPACTVFLDAVPVPAPYYVVSLGPAEGPQKLYQWAIVSDPFGLSLFVLARNVTDYYARFDAEVVAWTKAHDFNNFLNTPVATVQKGCTYWD